MDLDESSTLLLLRLLFSFSLFSHFQVKLGPSVILIPVAGGNNCCPESVPVFSRTALQVAVVAGGHGKRFSGPRENAEEEDKVQWRQI